MRAVLTAAAVALTLSSTPALSFTGNDALPYVKAYLAGGDNAATGFWLGMVAGQAAIQGSTLFEFPICYPENGESGQYAEIAAKYLLDHPEERHFEASVLIINAHLAAFGAASNVDCWMNAESKSD